MVCSPRAGRRLAAAGLFLLAAPVAHANSSYMWSWHISHEIAITGLDAHPDCTFWVFPWKTQSGSEQVFEGQSLAIDHSIQQMRSRWDEGGVRESVPLPSQGPSGSAPGLSLQEFSWDLQRPEASEPHLYAVRGQINSPEEERAALFLRSDTPRSCVPLSSLAEADESYPAARVVTTYRLAMFEDKVLHLVRESEQRFDRNNEPLAPAAERDSAPTRGRAPLTFSAPALAGLLLVARRRRRAEGARKS
jgi:hypothetical protein